MASDHRERELKFDAPDGWDLPDPSTSLEGAVVERRSVRLVSAYFDTPARELLGCHVTLRRRSGDEDVGWQLKLPAGDARTEVRYHDTGTEVPDPINEVTLGLRGGVPLAPVATLTTERDVHRIVASGVAVAELVVDNVSSSVEGEPGAAWREIEVELVDGDEDALQQIAAWVEKSGATPSMSGSKLGRVLGTSREPRNTSTMAGLIASYLDEQVEQLVRGDVGLRRGNDEIHDTRIATRRYRSVLRVFAKALEPERARALDDELAWYATALGEVRDRHVLREYLADALAALPPSLVLGPVAATINDAIDAELAKAEAELALVLRSPRYFALLREARVWRDELPGLADQPAVAAARYVKKAQRAVARRFERVPAADDADHALHSVRKAAKRARYAAEVAEPALGRSAWKAETRAHKMQRKLGKRQDTLLAVEFLRRLGAEGGGFTVGVLYERERARLQM